MSWALFAVVQLALTVVGVGVVFWLRNRELKARLAAAEQAAADAEALVTEAVGRFEKVSSDALDKWLADKIQALDEGDPVQAVQKRVLQNEQKPISDFDEDMQRRLAAGDEVREQDQAQWRELRNASHELASGLIERFPHSHPVLVQLYAAFSSLDTQYGVELPALPEPTAPESDGESGGSEEMEHLKASNELLRQQLEDLQKELEGIRSSGDQAQAQEEDLKALLQQFTRDSRDMMACIQELEQENQRLREALQQAGAPAAEGGPEPEADAPGANERADHAA